MIIHTRNEHPDMQANKLNAKYHLHVQYSTDTTTQGNCTKDIKSNKGHKSDVLKEMHNCKVEILSTILLALFRAKFACILAISNPVFMWESCKGSV